MQPKPQHNEFWVVRFADDLMVAEATVYDGKLDWWLCGSEQPLSAGDVTPIRKVDLSDAP